MWFLRLARSCQYCIFTTKHNTQQIGVDLKYKNAHGHPQTFFTGYSKNFPKGAKSIVRQKTPKEILFKKQQKDIIFLKKTPKRYFSQKV